MKRSPYTLTATTVTPKPVSFDLENLETLGTFHFEDQPGGQVTIVHPHYVNNGTVFAGDTPITV